MKMTKEQLAQWLVELDENVLQVAIMYAENYLKYGVDITEKWNTATKQKWSLERAERYGYAEGRNSIVRCKDCRWGEPTKNAYGEDRIICGNDDTYIDRYITVPADWFCADGERKTE